MVWSFQFRLRWVARGAICKFFLFCHNLGNIFASKTFNSSKASNLQVMKHLSHESLFFWQHPSITSSIDLGHIYHQGTNVLSSFLYNYVKTSRKGCVYKDCKEKGDCESCRACRVCVVCGDQPRKRQGHAWHVYARDSGPRGYHVLTSLVTYSYIFKVCLGILPYCISHQKWNVWCFWLDKWSHSLNNEIFALTVSTIIGDFSFTIVNPLHFIYASYCGPIL